MRCLKQIICVSPAIRMPTPELLQSVGELCPPRSCFCYLLLPRLLPFPQGWATGTSVSSSAQRLAHREITPRLDCVCALPCSATLRSGAGMKEERCKNRAKRSSSHPSVWCLFKILIEKLNLRFQFAGLEHCRLKYVPLNYVFGVIAVSTGGIIHKIRFALFNSAV